MSPGPVLALPSQRAPYAPVHDIRPGRQRMLDMARSLFCTGGYERTPLRAISDALGVTKAALYYHFKAKDDLLVSIVGPVLDRIDAILDAAGPVLESTAEREAFLGRYVEELSRSPDIVGLLKRDSGVREHAVGQRFAEQHARMCDMLGGGDELDTGIRTMSALRALELAVVDFDGTDPAKVRTTALAVAMAVLGAPDGT